MSDPVINLSIEIGEGDSEELFLKELETPFLPPIGTPVVLHPYEQAPPDDGPLSLVAKVWLAGDGSYTVELEPIRYFLPTGTQDELMTEMVNYGWKMYG